MNPLDFLDYCYEAFNSMSLSDKWTFYLALWASIEILFFIQWGLHKSIVRLGHFIFDKIDKHRNID